MGENGPGIKRRDASRRDPVGRDLVERLLGEQVQQWAGPPVRRLEPRGTDHAIFRLGADKLVRLARRPSAAAQVENEAAWLPRLAPVLPVPIPTPLAVGEPGCGYPHRWSVGAGWRGSR
jgi:aminoglycoside phosphotransferase (APT) family kinase protein